MKVHNIINDPYRSNTYIIEGNSNQVVLIDPGSFDISDILSWLDQNQKSIHSVILTHEHFDHTAGINSLAQFTKFELIASENCIINIASCRRNLSLYTDLVPTFEINCPSLAVGDSDELVINDLCFQIFLTPGHSLGSVCLFCRDSVFTGDTLLNGIKSPIKFPGSNRKEYSKSLIRLMHLLKPGMTIYPGHGEPFSFEDCVDI